jgi:RNA polymerase sigma-70 factor (ECF subfamily)
MSHPAVCLLPGSVDRDRRLRRMIDDYSPFVARVLRRAGTPPADVDDELQRTFITVARRLDEVRLGAERPFLLRTALNRAMHARRTTKRRREIPTDETFEQSDAIRTPERLVSQKQTRQLLDRILGEMKEPLRTVLVLRQIEEMTTTEIASILGVPRGTVVSRLTRALDHLRWHVTTAQVVQIDC